jgi:hypothetical protein
MSPFRNQNLEPTRHVKIQLRYLVKYGTERFAERLKLLRDRRALTPNRASKEVMSELKALKESVDSLEEF